MNKTKGAVFAFGAAFLNALVGVLSLTSFSTGLSAPHVAFYKCVAAFCMLSLLIILSTSYRQQVKQLSQYALQLAIMAFFGFFCLYFFETKAYTQNTVAIIVFTLLASSAITTYMVSYFMNHALERRKVICTLLAIMGLLCFSLQSSFSMNLGLICAGIAGSGYGMFLVLNNQFQLPIHGIALLWWLTLFGMLYLAVPFFLNNPKPLPLVGLPSILLLGIAPTIGGFYCTTKALTYSHATDVQLFEFAEPVIASLLAFVFYHQSMRHNELLGALMITGAILLSVRNVFSLNRKNEIDV